MPNHAHSPPKRPRAHQTGWALMLLVCLCMPSHALDVVVNPTNGATEISRQELLAIFTMRQRTWPDGTPITVFIVDQNSATHARFCKELLKVFPHQLRTIWDRLVYSGSGTAPIALKSEQILLEKLAATPGGIGYMESVDSGSTIKIITFNPSGHAVAR